jgi:hypothetical protein
MKRLACLVIRGERLQPLGGDGFEMEDWVEFDRERQSWVFQGFRVVG